MRIYRRESDGLEINDALDRDLAWITATYGEGFIEIIPQAPSNIALKIADVEELYKQKVYTNVEALFPSGTKTIQLRNDEDYRAFERVVLASITRQAARRDGAMVQFRTEDNTTQELPASEFIPVALDVLDAKHALWQVRTAHKDAISGLTEEQAATYNVNDGWPVANEPVWVQLERSQKIYKAMIRRRADVLSAEGNIVGAIELLKTIGE
jgi:hypothetical protein